MTSTPRAAAAAARPAPLARAARAAVRVLLPATLAGAVGTAGASAVAAAVRLPAAAPVATAATTPAATPATIPVATAATPSDGPAAGTPVPPPGRFAFRGYAAPVPTSWEPVPPGSGFRAAQYRVPAAPGAEPGEVIVYYFGAGQGGPVDANIARWTSQFSDAEGRPVTPQVRRLTAGGLPATLVQLDGRYARGIGAGSGTPKPGQTLLAAIVETPQGNLTFQLHGDSRTVAQHRAGFLAMLEGFAAGR